ncbi:MAG: hypothetical protein QOJ83_1134, partial [Frankiales bacterium]|nr:hypothetical protein [Frankiales bacterium]
QATRKKHELATSGRGSRSRLRAYPLESGNARHGHHRT